MAKRGLSIEIGVQKTKVCEIDFRRSHPKVYKVHTFHTPANTIEDGYIRDKAAFGAVLKKELESAGMKGVRDVIYTIASTTIANREITLPPVREKQLGDIVKATAQDYFPIDISGYTIAYSILEGATGDKKKDIRLLLFAAPDSLIQDYYSFSAKMGFRVEALDYIGNSSVQLLKRQVKEKTGITVQINEQTTMIQVFENGNLVVQRTVAYGARSSAESLMEHKVFDVHTEREAYDYLASHEVILSRSEARAAEEEAAAALAERPEAMAFLRAREEVTETLQYHINNIQRLIDYYHSKNPERMIETIYLTGTGAKINGVAEFFAGELGIRTIRMEELFGVDFTRQARAKAGDTTEFLSAIGAAIAPLGFLLKEKESKKTKKEQMQLAKVVMAFSVVAAVGMTAWSLFQYQVEKQRGEKLQTEIVRLEPVEAVYTENEKVNAYYGAINQMYFMTKTGNERFGQLIEELEKRLPVNMVVTSISGTEEGITINLETTTKISVAWLLLQMNQIDILTEVSVPAISSSIVEGEAEKFVFSVAAKYSEEAVSDSVFERVEMPVENTEETAEETVEE